MASKESAIVARTREIGEAVTDLHHTLQERLAPVRREVRGYRSDLRRPRALELGLALCVNIQSGDSLAARLKVVPAEYVDDDVIRCICGHFVPRRADRLEQCVGCDRWFVSDDSGTWAVRLPEAVEPDAA